MPLSDVIENNKKERHSFEENLKKRIQSGLDHYELLQILRAKHQLFCIQNHSDNFGADFKNYFITHNMPQVIKQLKNGLDDTSKQVVDENIDRLLNLPLAKSKYANKNIVDENLIKFLKLEKPTTTQSDIDCFNTYEKFIRMYTKAIMSPAQLAENEAYQSNVSSLKEKYLGIYSLSGSDARVPESFYYHHGLKLLSNRVLQYIRDKEFVDCGSLFGDSSLVFNEYAPSKVYAFEMNVACKEQYYENLRLNNIADIDRFVFVNKGVANENSKIKISKKEYATMTTQSEVDVKADECFAEFIKIDDFFEGHKIGLIKMDIEGAEYNAILGAKETIKRNKPLLLIAIYHTPQQYFELKPLIESWQLGYKFMIRDLRPFAVYSETTLIAIPKI